MRTHLVRDQTHHELGISFSRDLSRQGEFVIQVAEEMTDHRSMGALKQQIGQRIRRLRQTRKLPRDPSASHHGTSHHGTMTIGLLAREAGLSEDYLNKLELGRYMPSADKLVAIASALEVGVAELFPDDTRADEKTEALDDLRALASKFSEEEIRYLIEVTRVVMTHPSGSYGVIPSR